MADYKCGSRTITVTHDDRIWFPKSKISKKDIADYYYAVSQHMLPFMKNHPLTMQRFPAGIKHEGFYHKDAPDYFPSWIKTIKVKKKEGGNTSYVVCNNQATLMYLAHQGCITSHLWLSRVDKLDNPDRLIIDLDPGKSTFENVRASALCLKDFFEELGLSAFPMLTGSEGMHIVVPLKRKETFDEVYDFARRLAEIMVHKDPKNLTLEIRKNKRGKRIFVDVLRNQLTATAVSPYSVRPIEGAPVATPIDWEEVKDPKLTSQRYTIKTVFSRIKKNSLWKHFFIQSFSLKSASKKLSTLYKEI